MADGDSQEWYNSDTFDELDNLANDAYSRRAPQNLVAAAANAALDSPPSQAVANLCLGSPPTPQQSSPGARHKSSPGAWDVQSPGPGDKRPRAPANSPVAGPSSSPHPSRRRLSDQLRQERVAVSPLRSPGSMAASPSRSPASTPGNTQPTRAPGILLPFPLRFALHAAGVNSEALDLKSRSSLADAYTKDGWDGVLRATRQPGIKGVPRIAVSEPLLKPTGKQMTLGYRMRLDAVDHSLTCLMPKLRLETKADRTLGAEVLLQVVLVDAMGAEARGRPGEDINPHEKVTRREQREAREARIRQLLRECWVCGRRYEYFGTKDAGKAAEAIYLVAAAGPDEDSSALCKDGVRFRTAEEAWRQLACFESASSVPKMAARLELAFSPTFPTLRDRFFHMYDVRGRGDNGLLTGVELQKTLSELRRRTISPLDVYVIAIDDIVGVKPDGTGASCDRQGAPYILTDGCGLISYDLAAEIGQQLGWKDVPLLLQKRMWWSGYLSKGVLVISTALPPNVIVVRDSQIKLNGAPGAAGPPSLEINTCQRSPSEAKTSPLLVPLLEALGGEPMSGLLLEMQSAAAERLRPYLQHCHDVRELDADAAAELVKVLEPREEHPTLPGSVSLHKLLLTSGMDLRDGHVRTEVLGVLRQQLRAIGQGKFHIPGSHNLMVAVDHTHTLPEGHVVLLIEGRPKIAARCLLYKAPGLHPGDVRAATAVAPTPEMLDHLHFPTAGQNALLVSTHGARSILDMIAGSDADGDCFSVILHDELVALLPDDKLRAAWEIAETSVSSREPRRPCDLPSDELRDELLRHLMRCREGQCLIGKAANGWKKFVDDHSGCDGALRHGAVQRALHYMQMLDSAKASAMPHFPTAFNYRHEEMPWHLQKHKVSRSGALVATRARPPNSSPSLLERMFDAVESLVHHGLGPRSENCLPVHVDPDLCLVPQDNELMNRWHVHFEEYGKQCRQMSPFSAEKWAAVIADFRSVLLAGCSPARPDARLVRECKAMYESIYRTRQQKPCGECLTCERHAEPYRRKFNFVWYVAGDLLLHIKAKTCYERQQMERPLAEQSAMWVPDEARDRAFRRRGHRAIHNPVLPEERAIGPQDDDDDDVDDDQLLDLDWLMVS